MKAKILTLAGVGLFVASIFMAIKNAKEEAEETREEQDNEEAAEEETETLFEKVKRKAKRYWPTIALSVGAIFCVTMSLCMSTKAVAAAVTAYKFTADAYDKHKEATEEITSKKKASEIITRTAEKQMSETPLDRSKLIKEEGDETLFYDPISKEYFYSTVKYIKEQVRRLNEKFVHNGGSRSYITYGWFYGYIHGNAVPRVRDKRRALRKLQFDSNSIGWNSIDGDILIGFDCITLDDGEVCIVLTYRVAPYYDFCFES